MVSEPLLVVRVFPLFKLTPLGNPLICLILIFPLALLSCIFNGISKVAPLNTSTSGELFSELPSTNSLLFVGFVIFTVGGCVSRSGVGVTGALESDSTFCTLVLAVMAVDGNAFDTLIVAVVPVVFPVPITVPLLYKVTVEPVGTPLPTSTVTVCSVFPAFSFTEFGSITGCFGRTFNVTSVVFEVLSEYCASTL